MARQFQVTAIIPQTGPKGGKRSPRVEVFNVAADTRDEARNAFSRECPELARFVASVNAC
jgi:hypothetical protein